ncbi:MAG TPA: ECF-type sigma factor [Xanthomonadaceae bacterium]|nr:ECF-type sigma factor [Xanthomonadaceae bacterium]
MAELTELIVKARGGDHAAADHLFTVVYEDLRRLAARQLRAGDGGGMRTTSLVHETYLKLARPEALEVSDRAHFFSVAARAMRQITIDRVRAQRAARRGGGAPHESLAGAAAQSDGRDLPELLALDAALTRLDALEPRLARLVELRFFAGMGLEEAGAALGLSERTLKRDWRRARAFLHGAMEGAGGGVDID